MSKSILMPGDRVEVRSAEEILSTLDSDGCLDKLPFMPEMLQFCGKQFHVFRRADKTCDTVNRTGGRRLHSAVHLDNLRCDGSSHGGCQAACLLFWNEAWLKPATAPFDKIPSGDQAPTDVDTSIIDNFCVRNDSGSDEVAYECQATTLPEYTSLLHWWDIRQYWRDLRTGNTTFGRMIRIFSLAVFRMLINLGVGTRFLIRTYNGFQKLRNGEPYPVIDGKLEKTPVETLNLEPGEYVRVKSLEEITQTLDHSQKNRGLWFDQEMSIFCGGVYRVNARMSKIIDERTGKMLQFGTPSVVLENVYCQSEFSNCRLFCPRSIYSYWRESWLERLDGPG